MQIKTIMSFYYMERLKQLGFARQSPGEERALQRKSSKNLQRSLNLWLSINLSMHRVKLNKVGRKQLTRKDNFPGSSKPNNSQTSHKAGNHLNSYNRWRNFVEYIGDLVEIT